MIFAVDVGNTHIVLGCLDNGKIIHTARITTDRNKTDNEYAVTIGAILGYANIDLQGFDGAIISSVVPQVTEPLRLAIKLLMNIEPMVVGAGIKTGLNILIDNPAQLGADLAVGAVAVLDTCDAPIIVLDMGTATTLSIVSHHNSFIGCIILPGVMLSLNALSGGTSQLPSISIDAPKRVIGKNTVDCMKSGMVYGTASMIDGLIDKIEAELGEKTTVVATGGLSGIIIPYCTHEIIYDADLLLHGLEIIYNKNKK